MRVLLVVLLLASWAAQSRTIDESIKLAADKVGVPYKLLRAICFAESRLRPTAYVHEDGGAKNAAFGLCQILYSTAKSFGMNDVKCSESNFDESPRNYQTCKLFGPYTNAYFAARYLKYQLKRYKWSWVSAIAAYNTGSVKICKSGKVRRKKDGKVLYSCQRGGLFNQKYVDRVLKALQH